jgi:hypothetical protein
MFTLRTIPLLLAVTAGFVPARSFAQLGSDIVPRGRVVGDEEEIREEFERSRFHLGPVRLIPQLEFSEVGYDSNVYGTDQDIVGDWSVTAQAGLDLLLRVGPKKVFLQGVLLPRYTWYEKLSNRRTLGGKFGGSFYGFFNRLGLRLSGFQSKSIGHLSSETETQAKQDTTSAAGKLDVRLTRSLWLFSTADYEKLRTRPIAGEPTPPETVLRYARTDTAVQAGLREQFSQNWSASVAVEGTRSHFVLNPELRNNRSSAYLLGVFFDRPRLFVNLFGGFRRGRPDEGSTFRPYSMPTGSGFVSYVVSSRVELQVYGHRSVAYGSFLENPYFIENRYGGLAIYRIHPRIDLQAFGEGGVNDYRERVFVGNSQVKRQDDVTAYGGGGRVLVRRRLFVRLLYSRTEYRSNVPNASRTIARFTTNLGFERE